MWTAEEIEEILGEEEAELLGQSYGVTPGGNFEGNTILNLERTVGEVAQEAGAAVETMAARLAAARQKLFTERKSG